MLLEITEIPHGFGQRKSTYTLVHTHSSCSKHSAEVCSLFLWSSSTLHISCHCLLKNFYFPYLNMLIYSQLSFRATWYPLHPTAAKSQFLSASLSLFLSVWPSKQKQVNRTEFSPPGFLWDWGEHVVIFALPGDYTFLQGLPSLLKHSPTRHTQRATSRATCFTTLVGLHRIAEPRLTVKGYSWEHQFFFGTEHVPVIYEC